MTGRGVLGDRSWEAWSDENGRGTAGHSRGPSLYVRNLDWTLTNSLATRLDRCHRAFIHEVSWRSLSPEPNTCLGLTGDPQGL